jgi:hypothetical protein
MNRLLYWLPAIIATCRIIILLVRGIPDILRDWIEPIERVGIALVRVGVRILYGHR